MFYTSILLLLNEHMQWRCAKVFGAWNQVNFVDPLRSEPLFLRDRVKNEINYSPVAYIARFHRRGQHGERARASLYARGLGWSPSRKLNFCDFYIKSRVWSSIQSEFLVLPNAAPNTEPLGAAAPIPAATGYSCASILVF